MFFDAEGAKEFLRFFMKEPKKVILFGTGVFAEKLVEQAKELGIDIAYCVDNDSEKWDQEFNQLKIKNPEALKEENRETLYVIIASMYYKEMAKQLQAYGIDNFINAKYLLSIGEFGLKCPMDMRKLVGGLWLQEGSGIEIGALHEPLPLNRNLKVQYVDVIDDATWREKNKNNENMKDRNVVKVDIIDRAEELNNIKDDSLDFIIANHVLEHTFSPIGTIETFMKKLKKKGKVFLSIPDKRFTFDQKRKLTSFEHLVEDYADSGEQSRYEHYLDFLTLSKGMEQKEAQEKAMEMMKNKESTHFHVWDLNSLLDFLIKTHHFLKSIFEIKHFQQNGMEIICVLEKD